MSVAHSVRSCNDGLAFVNDASIKQMNAAVSVLGETGIVGGHADGRAFPVEFTQQFHDAVGVMRIEVAGRFVRQQDGRVAGENPGYGNALLLAAGKL